MNPPTKKEARVQGLEMFIQAGGKMTNVEIANVCRQAEMKAWEK